MTAALLAALAAGLGGAALVELLATRPRRRGVPVRAAGGRDPRPAGERRPRGGAAVALLAAAGRSATGRPGTSRGLDARVAAAGVRASAEEIGAARVGAALVGLGVVLPLAWSAPGRLGFALVAIGPVAGHMAPLVWLRRRARRRSAAIEAELADVLDLLRVAIAAGLAPMRALAEVGRRHPGLLAGELRRASGRRALGMPASVVLAELERRCPAPGVAALCAALARADRHGAPLGDALRAQARDARGAAAMRTAEAAARASPRIQLVVALLLVPSVLLLVAAGLLPALTGR
jgi:tight adherence protein C